MCKHKKEVKKIIRAALKRGWEKVNATSKNHTRLRWTNGQQVTLSNTPSCHHAVKNMSADLNRVERQPA